MLAETSFYHLWVRPKKTCNLDLHQQQGRRANLTTSIKHLLKYNNDIKQTQELFIWQARQDNQQNKTITVPPMYFLSGKFLSRLSEDGIAWVISYFLLVRIIDKTNPPNSRV